MNRISITLFSILLIFGCQKDELDKKILCHQMGTNSNYLEEEFKPSYTIQFPDTYIGDGLHFPGETPVFLKSSSIGIVYNCDFPCATDCHIYFGQILETPHPESIIYSDYTHQTNGEILDEYIEFCLDQELYMILYYSSGEFKKSKLFINDYGEFKDGLTIEFEKSNFEEVIEVLKTIKIK